MGRESRYRGRYIETGEWVYGYLIGNGVIVGDIVEFNDEYFNTEYWYKVDPETVGQYTGLKDKYGREIYEGDILHHHWNSGHDHMLETTSFVKWQNGAFFVDDKKRSDWKLSMHALADWASVKIIGNIYENPELEV